MIVFFFFFPLASPYFTRGIYVFYESADEPREPVVREECVRAAASAATRVTLKAKENNDNNRKMKREKKKKL